MRLNNWQSCNMSSDVVTSSDDFPDSCLYGFEDDMSPTASSRGSLSGAMGGDSQSWDENNVGTTDSGRVTSDNVSCQAIEQSQQKGLHSNASGGNKSASSNTPNKKKGGRNRSSKSSYKHVPHREKPPHLVARRNARERRRVQAVNTAFARLRKCVPLENRNKRLSKVKTLQRAIEYINNLQDLLDDYEAISKTPPNGVLPTSNSFGLQQNVSSVLANSTIQGSPIVSSSNNSAKNANVQSMEEGLMDSFDDFMDSASVVNKENQVHQRWISLENSYIPENYGTFIPFYDEYNQGALHA